MGRILIAEDETRLAAFIAKGLTARGYRTTVVSDGCAAAAAARDEAFDLVILDLGLPGLDGIGVLKRLRGRGERLPVIVITASDRVQVRGANDLLPKPFRFAELLASVRAQLAAHR